ncbi:lytic murein transglycosylase B [Castellaniella sp.]|uniref:lytic murein transglycosylase B n=1 Tax=Castellaniella sp. TaxID=1955812 RepID=UPI0035608630
MLRPTRNVQFIALLFVLAGCATSHGGDAPAGGQPTGAAQPASKKYQTFDSNRGAPALASSQGDFVGPDGDLLPELAAFARDVSQDRGLPMASVEALLKEARLNATAIRLMAPPPQGRRIRRAWQSYRTRHVDPIRIRRGVEFWQAHQAELDRASARTGVPAAIIVAIIGIETVYGQYMGDHKVLDTLATLGFRYPDPQRPERQALFRNQLADLLELHVQGLLDARSVHGSFAGAMGLAQFMPGSLMRYAADGDGDGRIDLHGSTADAIASVARFLDMHGWIRGLPVFAPVDLPQGAQRQAQESLVPETDWAALQALGAKIRPGSATAWEAYPLGIVNLRDEIRGTHDVRCATPNFFAITQYNRSYFYAASVADLATEISRRM